MTPFHHNLIYVQAGLDHLPRGHRDALLCCFLAQALLLGYVFHVKLTK